MLTAFVTGSYAYGQPTPESDIDLCVRVTPFAASLLSDLAERPTESDTHVNTPSAFNCGDISLRFGRLNLLCLPERKFKAWFEATAHLTERKMNGETIDREFAISTIERYIEEAFALDRETEIIEPLSIADFDDRDELFYDDFEA